MRCSGGRDLLSCRAFALHRCSRSLYILYGIHGIHELTSCSGNRTQDMDWNRFISNRLWSGDRQIISKFPFTSFGAISHHHVSDLKHQPRDAFEITEEERQQDAERWAEFRASLAAKICQDIVVHLLCAAWFWYVLVCVCDLPYRAWSHEESPFAIQGKKEAERKQMEEERRKAFEESERKWAEEEAKKKKAEERKVEKVKVRDPEEEEDDEAGLVMLWDAAFVKVLGSNVAGDHTQTPLRHSHLWEQHCEKHHSQGGGGGGTGGRQLGEVQRYWAERQAESHESSSLRAKGRAYPTDTWGKMMGFNAGLQQAGMPFANEW